MAEHITSSRAQADHYRELAAWTSDDRTRHILIQMARELETGQAGASRPGEAASGSLPRSLS